MQKHPIIIKRYTNRKLYDTELRRYVTVKELASRATRQADGDWFQVIDNETKYDITSEILAQIVVQNASKIGTTELSFFLKGKL